MSTEINYTELLNSQNKDAFVANWRLKGSNNSVRRITDKELGVTVCLLDGSSSQTSIRLPRDSKTVLRRAERYLVLQLYVPEEADFSVLLDVTSQGQSRLRYRLLFSTAYRDTEVSADVAKIPFGSSLARGRWTSLCFDQQSFVSELWNAQKFESLDALTLTATCRLRRVFMMRTLESNESETGEWCAQQCVPKELRIANGTFLLLAPDRIRGSSGSVQKTVRVKATQYERVSVSPHPPDNAPHRPSGPHRRVRPTVSSQTSQRTAESGVCSETSSANSRHGDAESKSSKRVDRPAQSSADSQKAASRNRAGGAGAKNQLRESTSADSLISTVADSNDNASRSRDTRSLRNRSGSLEHANDAVQSTAARVHSQKERDRPQASGGGAGGGGGGGRLFTFANPPKVALPPSDKESTRDGSGEKSRPPSFTQPQKVDNVHFSTDFSLPQAHHSTHDAPVPTGSRTGPKRGNQQTKRISRDRLRELSAEDVIQKASPRGMQLESVREQFGAEQPLKSAADGLLQAPRFQVAELSDSCEARMLESLRREQEDELQSDSSVSGSHCSSPRGPAAPALGHLGLDRDLLHYETAASVDEQQLSSTREEQMRRLSAMGEVDKEMLNGSQFYADEMRLLLLGNRWDANLDVSNPRVSSPARSSQLRRNDSVATESDSSRLLMIADASNSGTIRSSSEELDLLYDPTLNCYYDPVNGRYYELA